MMCLTSSLSNTCTQLDYVESSIQVWVVLPWTAYYNWLIVDSVDYDKDDGSAAVDLLLNTECHCPFKIEKNHANYEARVFHVAGSTSLAQTSTLISRPFCWSAAKAQNCHARQSQPSGCILFIDCRSFLQLKIIGNSERKKKPSSSSQVITYPLLLQVIMFTV